MFRWIVLVLLASACATSRATAPDLGLAERFEIVAFALAEPQQETYLNRWEMPLVVTYDGPTQYRQTVIDQAHELGDITGLPVSIDGELVSMHVEISDRDSSAICSFSLASGYRAEVLIWSALPDREIRQCIAQEMTQPLGLYGDLDSPLGSRQDTVFASYGGSLQLTPADRSLIKILYDPRLFPGMSRDHTMNVVRQIVAEMEAEQEAQIR